MTPSGFSFTHSKNLKDVSKPNFGKLSTMIYGILVDWFFRSTLSKNIFSTFDIMKKPFEQNSN